MRITNLLLFKPVSKIRLMILCLPAILLLTACNDTKPDYVIKRARVDAMSEDIANNPDNPVFRVTWRVEVMIENKGGNKGLEPNEFGVAHADIPILFSAFISNEKLAGCPMQDTDDVVAISGPLSHTLLAWRKVPVKSGPIFSFSKVFITNANPPNICVPDKIKVNWDASEPDFESTVDELDEINNDIFIEMVNWPQQKTWVTENF